MQRDDSTIVAIATPPGRGGVAIVRLSGLHAYAIGQRIAQLADIIPRKALVATFLADDGSSLDHGILLYFKAPYSFTGEDIIEFHCHGSPIVLDCMVKQCIAYGARLARPGEFSERAFLNDKIDLAQAEAIADLIHAHSETAARMALRSLDGVFSKSIHALNDRILYVRMYIEAAIDFPDEEITFLRDGKVHELLKTILSDLALLLASATQGSRMREGINIVIAGRPNVGKSTLINALAAKDIAIVTDVAGTTRDVMREHIMMDELPVHIIDTAGLRDSDDIVEQEGIKRAWNEISQADCVLLVDDVTKGVTDELDARIRSVLPPEIPVIYVHNKVDVKGDNPRCEKNHVYIAAKTQQGLPLLKTCIKDAIGFQMPEEGAFLARRRHLQALMEAQQHVQQGMQQLVLHHASELLAEDLRLAHHALSTIVGVFTADDLLGEIFSSFCIGK